MIESGNMLFSMVHYLRVTVYILCAQELVPAGEITWLSYIQASKML